MSEYATIGKPIPRIEGGEKVTGGSIYVDDISRPGMLHGAYLLSPYPHARIVKIDTTVALGLPGVRCVLTGADFPRLYGAFVKDEDVLARHHVRYVGEPVAAVAAVDLATARRAIELIEVEYEELPALLTPEESLSEGAPAIHEEFPSYWRRFKGPLPVNVCAQTTLAEGDIELGFARAEVVVEATYETPAQVHCYMEPCGAVAEIDDAGRIVIWSPCQAVHRVQATTAEILGVSMSKVRVILTRVGGAFGGKTDTTVQPVAAMMALRTRKPVKLVLSRTDDFMMMRTRHPAKIWMRTGALRDGTLVARQARLVLDGGAYAEDSSAVLGFAMMMARGPYRIANVQVEGQVAYTNRLRAAGFRGYGNPQITFAGESQIDELASKLGMDALDLRLRNAMVTGDAGFGGQTAEACGLIECLERVRAASAWDQRQTLVPTRPGRRRGIGIASVMHTCAILSTSAIVRVLEDGTITLSVGAVDLGQGSDTALAQMCAEALQVPLERVNFAPPDTDGSPYNWATGGSRVTYMVGRAVAQAAYDARDKMFEHAGAMLECSACDLELRPEGRIGVLGVPGAEVSFQAVSQHAHWQVGGPIHGTSTVMFEGTSFDPKRTTVSGNSLGNVGVFVFGAQAAEVEVDEVTGETRVLNFWAAHDVGRAINTGGVRGQITGGVAQGIGYALYEDLVFDDGRPANPTLMDYKVPGAHELPDIEAIIVENPEPSHPFGVRGVGEPPIVGVAPAIANAIANACGARLRRLPMTPESVLDAMDGQGA
ncbi:xanthine dehydrogenase family protein molybdopterin-binding subunit [Variovorax sp. M-6]|uniref:xanthine dehydrogenase family protein molybdopterin-binding subunit n=1 Tax=Variovorax sp. M-6 TaxID=3233041 RepID=UPI003F9BE8A4